MHVSTAGHGSPTMTTKTIISIPVRSSQSSMKSGAWRPCRLVSTIITLFVMATHVNTLHRLTPRFLKPFSLLADGCSALLSRNNVVHPLVPFSWVNVRVLDLYFIPHSIGTLITGVSLAVGGVFREHRTFSFRSVVFTFICCPFSSFCILFSYSRHSTLSFRNSISFISLRFNGCHHRINKPQRIVASSSTGSGSITTHQHQDLPRRDRVYGLKAASLHTFEQKWSAVPLGIFKHMMQALT